MKIEMKLPLAFTLTADEISVCAAFMKIPHLYGMKPSFPINNEKEYKKRIIAVVAELESRRVIKIKFDGNMDLNSSIYRSLNCMGFPERMIWAVQVVEGTKLNFYFYFKGNQVTVIKEREGDLFEFYHSDTLVDSSDIFKIDEDEESIECDLQVPKKLILDIKNLEKGFDTKRASQLLKEQLHLKEEYERMIWDLCRQKVDILSMVSWEWSGNRITSGSRYIIGSWNSKSICLASSQAGFINIKHVLERNTIKAWFEKQMKRG